MDHSSSSVADDTVARCERHGPYRAAVEVDGVLRWLPRCPRCDAEARSATLLDRAGIPPRFLERTLENYQADTAGQRVALAAARRYAASFSDALKRGTCMIFAGNVGTGKTHLACGIAREVMRHGYTALFVTVSEAIRAVRSTWRRDAERSEEQVLREFTAVDLLILDEVGVQFGTEAEQVTLFEIINRRYAHLRPTLILSNLPVQSDSGGPTLRDYLGERAFDRLREGDGKLIAFDWQSYRRKV